MLWGGFAHLFHEGWTLEGICPNCGTRNEVRAEGELSTPVALGSLATDFFLLGPLAILGFFGHEPVETTCPNCGCEYHVRLNMRLRAYDSPSWFYAIVVYAFLAAALLFLLLEVW